MRLSTFERQAIKQAASECFQSDACVHLFGSRTHDDVKGGDIDLLISTTITDPADIARGHIQFLSSLYQTLGEQKIDVLIDYPTKSHHPAIFAIAAQEGVWL